MSLSIIISCSTGFHSSLALELKNGDTVSNVMQECGFSDPSLKTGAWQLLEKWSNCSKLEIY